jgi:ribosomal protein S18 acetylase RimI-like enzyme
MINIRKLKSKDRGVISAILKNTEMFTDQEIDVALELIDVYLNNKDQKDYLIYVAETTQGEVVGYVCYGPTAVAEGTYDLYWIAVDSSYQGRGIGKQLLTFTEEEVGKLNGRLIIIETSSQEKYASTQNFYLGNRYLLAARIKDYYRAGDDRLIYVKYLNNHIS